MRAAFVLALGCLVAACSGSSSAPTSITTTMIPAASTWTLSGTIKSSGEGNVNAATVLIVDGPDASRQITTDTSGKYTFAGLKQAGFTVRASANGYITVAQGVTLTTDTVVDFQLPRVLVAALTFEGSLTYTTRADGGYDMSAVAVNTGDGCASSVSGVTTLTGQTGLVLTYSWTLPASVVIRPGERTPYYFGPLSRADVIAFGDSGLYVTRFSFTSGACQ